MKVICPNCKRKDFETTTKYIPEMTPNGGMVKCLLPYQIDWLCKSTTLAAEMTCPECLSPIVVRGRLLVEAEQVEQGKEVEAVKVEEPVQTAFVCDVCGKECRTPASLVRHQSVHKEEANG